MHWKTEGLATNTISLAFIVEIVHNKETWTLFCVSYQKIPPVMNKKAKGKTELGTRPGKWL